MSNEFIYQMIGTEKILPSGRSILQPTWLSFFPDAKIGVLGHNGAGKSTLMKIMAGLDDAFNGEAILKRGASVGYLSQEPELDETLDVKGNIELGVKPIRGLLDAFDAVSARFAEDLTDEQMDKAIADQARLQDEIDAARA